MSNSEEHKLMAGKMFVHANNYLDSTLQAERLANSLVLIADNYTKSVIQEIVYEIMRGEHGHDEAAIVKSLQQVIDKGE